MIGSLTHIDYKVSIGENTRIEGSVYIPPPTVIGKNVFIGPGATFTNDPYPMSPKMTGVIVNDGAIVGGGAKN
jgi:UDP-3-O-[3-hydroxymyristoyl] glucosamine N-acyltransferase